MTSSRYGDVQDDGGMELDIPYLVVGDLQKYDKNGWMDPRKDNPHMVKDLQSLLFGKKSKQKFEVFEPSFVV